MTRGRSWGLCVIAVLVLAGGLRGLWLTADPPTTYPVGVVWHDEGAWVHNARNQALWGVWRTDEWNPMFIAPVFTALEAVAFEAVGVGTWQARMVPLFSGLIAILALMWGVAGVAGRRAALYGGILLATSYTSVMWNRAALMESTMTMFIVIGWAAYARSHIRPGWGVVAGAAVVLAFFTKAAAAFFVAALLVELATLWWSGRRSVSTGRSPASAVLLGLAMTGAAAMIFFVVPHWAEFQFYNWQMTVTRKTDYGLGAFRDRATWLPLAHGVFTRMWLVLVAAAVATTAIVSRWRSAHPAERLAVLWLLVGLVELLVHDSGNERRYVMFIPGLVALVALRLGNRPASEARPETVDQTAKWVVAPVVGVLAYLVVGSALRLVWQEQVLAGDYRLAVRVSAALATVVAGAVWWRWHAWSVTVATTRIPAVASLAILVITSSADLTLYGAWVNQRTFHNYQASRDLAALLPSGTLVHGKLANGLALENRMAPVFVGRGFGNYADRLERDDARYILTYTQPWLGYEGSVILDVLEHYPQQRVIAEFDVDETPGPDRAALIDKFPDRPEPRARYQ